MAKAKRAPPADLSNISVVRVLALEICGLERLGDCADIISRFDPYECPSFRVTAAVRRARVSHPKSPEPGDKIDEDHLAYAPYVDLMVVDKRTRSFAEQESRRSHGLLRPADISSLAQARHLQEVMGLVKRTTERNAGAS
jgi:hypothetical protein